MNKRKVLLEAEHINWSLQAREDWHGTHFILYEDGELRCVDHIGCSLTEDMRKLPKESVEYIRDHIKEYIRPAETVSACDGTAWKVTDGTHVFGPDYVYDTDLEKITDILYLAWRD